MPRASRPSILSSLSAIEVARPSELILQQWRHLIDSGGLRPGDRLPAERDLARQFGVGRSHVRDALRRLEFYGILETHAQSGTVVARLGVAALNNLIGNVLALDGDDIAALLETRVILEVETARLAAQRATAAQLRAIALARGARAVAPSRVAGAVVPARAARGGSDCGGRAGGALVGVVMILMIGKGVVSGVATSTEISAFAVIYAIVVGWAAFRELTGRSLYKLFVDSATLAGMIMFIVAAASGVGYSLTFEQIPHALADVMVSLAHTYGTWLFMVISVLALIVFGAVLEGAPALIIFGPLLTPIAVQLGYHPLHFGIVLVIAMGIGLFSPPFGLGMYATCTIAQTRLQDVVRPYVRYVVVLLVTLALLIAWPALTLWLPKHYGLG